MFIFRIKRIINTEDVYVSFMAAPVFSKSDTAREPDNQ